MNASIDGQVIDTLHANLLSAIALDYHYQKHLIFFTDISTKKVYRATYGKKDAKVISLKKLEFAGYLMYGWG